MPRELPESDFRRVRRYLTNDDFAWAEGPEFAPEGSIDQDIWHGIVELPTDVAIKTTDCRTVDVSNGGRRCPDGVPCLPEGEIDKIIDRFDALSPYDRSIVPHLLKVEYPAFSDLRCFAISAKRYVLYRVRSGNRIEIVKASESALGAIIGRSPKESTAKLVRRIWLSILMKHLKVNPNQRRRAKPLGDFDVPLRRKFPISQPSILARLKPYNKTRSYDLQVKPFGFVQTVTPVTVIENADPLPIAPFEADVTKSRRLPWVDFNTGDPIRLDWSGSGMDGTIPVMRLSEHVEQYQRHPEAKAADRNGNPAGPDTIGLLGRLRIRSTRLTRIGKEADRLDEDDGVSLAPSRPAEYECDHLAQDIDYLAQFSQEQTARDLKMSVRGWRSLIHGVSAPRSKTAQRIRDRAQRRRIRAAG